MTDECTLVAPIAGWASALSEVPDPVFADGLMGSGLAIDPTGDTLHAPCDGIVTSIHAAGHAVALTTDTGAELLLHIGIDSVAMGGEGFVRLVPDGARVTCGQPLVRFDLDLVVQRARSAVTPVLLVGDGFSSVPIGVDRLVAVGDPLLHLTRTATVAAAVPVASPAGAWQSLVVALPHGLHARPAARIAAAARGRDAVVTLVCGEASASALSMTGLLGLGAKCGATVSIEAQGRDAHAVAAAVAAILTSPTEPDTPTVAAAPTPVRAVTGDDFPSMNSGIIAGVGAVPGLAIGSARWLRRATITLPPVGDADAERVALAVGLKRLVALLDGQSGVMAAHRALLDDPALLAAIDTAVTDGDGAAGAALRITREHAGALARSNDRRIAERADDLIDIGERLAHAILGTHPDALRLDAGTVLIADDLLPSQIAALDATPPAGIAVMHGGPTSHVAIMAAARGIPMVVALGAGLSDIPDGASVIVDGDHGHVCPMPDEAMLATTAARIARSRAAEAHARTLGADGPSATRDGRAIGILANLGTAADAAAAVADGAEGCGLLRTELLFLDRPTPPTRMEQAGEYRAIATAMAGRPVTIRLLDVGGDKPAPYLNIPREDNPALGLRGVRVMLQHPDLLEAQISAILNAADAGPCRIMVPMVASLSELAAVRAVLDRLRGDRTVQFGAMIETPAAAIGADVIASACDFLSIGSNDLTQYVLAMDRGNPAVAGAIDGLHPAVLRLIEATCRGAARHDVPVGVCGGLAADPLAVPILIGLGVTSLSVPPTRIAATRALVAGLSHADAAAHALTTLACDSPTAVRALARGFAERSAA